MIAIVRDGEPEGQPRWVVGLERGQVYIDTQSAGEGPRAYSPLEIKPEHLPLLIEDLERLQALIEE